MQHMLGENIPSAHNVAEIEVIVFRYASAIKGADFALRELRVQSRGAPIRVFYAFDPIRQAVLLMGGDKTGDKRK